MIQYSIVEHLTPISVFVVLQINEVWLADLVEVQVPSDGLIHFDVAVDDDCEEVLVVLVEDGVEHVLEPEDLVEVELFNDDAEGQLFAVFV